MNLNFCVNYAHFRKSGHIYYKSICPCLPGTYLLCLFLQVLVNKSVNMQTSCNNYSKTHLKNMEIDLSTIGTKHCMCKRLLCDKDAHSLTPSFVIFCLSKGTKEDTEG